VLSWRSSNFGICPNNVDKWWRGEFSIWTSNGCFRSKQTSTVAPVSLPIWGKFKRRPRCAKHHTLTHKTTKFFLLR
jgi:hypothetical protein